jgi:hypothetical protein
MRSRVELLARKKPRRDEPGRTSEDLHQRSKQPDKLGGYSESESCDRELLPLTDSVAVALDRIVLVGAVLVVLAALDRVLGC